MMRTPTTGSPDATGRKLSTDYKTKIQLVKNHQKTAIPGGFFMEF
jgi:hypothetical protein